MKRLDCGDRVRLLRYPPDVYGVVKRRCSRDNRYIWVEIEERDGEHRVKEKDVEKTLDDPKG